MSKTQIVLATGEVYDVEDKEYKLDSESQCTCFMTHWCLSQKDG